MLLLSRRLLWATKGRLSFLRRPNSAAIDEIELDNQVKTKGGPCSIIEKSS
jgi:hypothetical protein